jgi:Uma2 family endonuclease
VEQYHAMIEHGILTPEDRCELLEGLLVSNMSKDEPHIFSANEMRRALERFFFEPAYTVRTEAPITLDDGEPEPDVAVVEGDRRKYLRLGRKPGPADTLLVVEISDSTLQKDRGIKRRNYAKYGIPMFWIVNLLKRRIEVHTDPDTLEPEPAYRSQVVYDESARVPVVIAGQTVGEITVADVLP